MNEELRKTRELRCPFLHCKSKKVACVGYVDSRTGFEQSVKEFNKQLFQCQECERKFLYVGKL